MGSSSKKLRNTRASKNKKLHSKIINILQAGENSPEEISILCDCGMVPVFRVKKEINTSQKI